MAYKISEECISCGSCAGTCPVEAISEGESQYVIDPEKCMKKPLPGSGFFVRFRGSDSSTFAFRELFLEAILGCILWDARRIVAAEAGVAAWDVAGECGQRFDRQVA